MIFLEIPDGETIKLPVEDFDTTTIEDLKRTILDMSQLPLNEQHLFLKDSDEELEDGDKLSAHGIENNSTLCLKVGISQPALFHTLFHCPPH